MVPTCGAMSHGVAIVELDAIMCMSLKNTIGSREWVMGAPVSTILLSQWRSRLSLIIIISLQCHIFPVKSTLQFPILFQPLH